jgi:hypothetical protein
MSIVVGNLAHFKVATVLTEPAVTNPSPLAPAPGLVMLLVAMLFLIAAAHLARPFAQAARVVTQAVLSAMLLGGALALVLVFFLLHR